MACCGVVATHQHTLLSFTGEKHTNFSKQVSHKPVFPSEVLQFPAQKVCVVRVFSGKKTKTHKTGFAPKIFFEKNTGLKKFECLFFSRERQKVCVLVGGWVGGGDVCVGGGRGEARGLVFFEFVRSFLKTWPKMKLQSSSVVTIVARARPVLLVTCQGCFHCSRTMETHDIKVPS